ncbi:MULTISPECIES: hypothetical protein [unclassified Synechococcus]|nr:MULTISPECIES: hypothetical protein [unclassified Synechococcus]
MSRLSGTECWQVLPSPESVMITPRLDVQQPLNLWDLRARI